MRRVVTTINPDREIEVEESEFVDLSAQGLVKEDKTPKSAKPKEERSNA